MYRLLEFLRMKLIPGKKVNYMLEATTAIQSNVNIFMSLQLKNYLTTNISTLISNRNRLI
jgi:hypothetical protein